MQRKALLLALLLAPLSFAEGQSIHITGVSKYQVCARETIKVYYSASGSFAMDNIFYAQISDENGTFAGSQNVGQASGMTDSIAIVCPYPYYSGNYRIRIFSSDPFVISDTSFPDIHVYWPEPQAKFNLKRTSFFGWIGFVGNSITCFDGIPEMSGSTIHWKFDQDYHIDTMVDSSAIVTYPTTGWKTGRLTVTDPIGCDSTDPFRILMLSCNPIIPDSAHIVTGTESGTYPFVWVKTGGNYTNLFAYDYYGISYTPTVFVEPGGTVSGGNAAGIYYLKDNATFTITGGEIAIIVLNKKWVNYYDTIYCPDLQFNYSQVTGNGVEEEDPVSLQIETSPNHLHVTNDGVISAAIYDLLGIKLLSKKENDILDFDLTSLSDGVYFAIVESGNHREMRKIAVVH
ncbi:MAG: T9SS type A sorting domain-containing protein [Candidatus Kapaibacterium sp.]